MDINKIEKEIEKTGYVLEYLVSNILIKHGWVVINNKQYLDDIQETVREIDLIAYKASEMQHLHVYTTLIISCKKSIQNAWVLLSKDINIDDPNINWNPIHIWTNDRALSYATNQPNWYDSYLFAQVKGGCANIVQVPEKQVFAFQEMNKENGRPDNDRNIFNSITSLMKAQAFELNVLPERKKSPSLYQFNLLSVMDTDLIRLDFTNASRDLKEIEQEIYLSNYIVNKKQTSSRIHFVKYSSVDKVLNYYDKLHEINLVSFDRLLNNFYVNVFSDFNRKKIFLPDFRHTIHSRLWFELYKNYKIEIKEEEITLLWSNETQSLDITISSIYDKNIIAFLNRETKLKENIKDALAKIYRYHGNFKFEVDDIAF